MNATESSGNMKELKHVIYGAVSNLRTLFVKLNDTMNDRNQEIVELEREVKDCKDELTARRKANEMRAEEKFVSLRRETSERSPGHSALPTGSVLKYSNAVTGDKKKRFRLTVKSKEKHTTEAMKTMLKSKINPTEIKVGISAFKSLRDGRILIESGSKEEIEALGSNINEKCGKELEARVHKLRNPMVIIVNVPEEVNKDNAEETIITQNPELNLLQGDIKTKFCFTTKKHIKKSRG